MNRRIGIQRSISELDNTALHLVNTRAELLLRLEDVSRSLEDLGVQRAELVESMALTEGDIPDEILAMIFAVGQEDETDWISSGSPFRMIVSHVSNRWREVAIHHPRLWSSFRISNISTNLESVSTHLKRSSEVPLDIVIYADGTIPDSSNFSAAMDLLIEQAFRWRSITAIIHCSFHSSHASSVIKRLEEVNAPRLQHLRLCSTGAETWVRNLVYAGPTHSLRSLQLTRVALPWISAILHNLTALELGHLNDRMEPRHTDLSAMIASLPSLQHLTIASGHLGWLAGGIIEIPSLISLSIRHVPSSKVPQICGYFSTPNLQRLNISGISFLKFVDILGAVLNHSGRPRYRSLRSFYLSNFTLPTLPDPTQPNYPDADFLRGLPKITEIFLDGVSDAILALLRSQAEEVKAMGGCVLCPELRTITLAHGCYDERLLRDMIYARTGVGRPIHNLALGMHCPLLPFTSFLTLTVTS